MKLYRFDPSAGSAVDAYGSNFVLSRLAGSDSTSLRAACFHLEPGGVVGRHRATAGQLFCVLAGDGWVAGEDGERRVCRHNHGVSAPVSAACVTGSTGAH